MFETKRDLQNYVNDLHGSEEPPANATDNMLDYLRGEGWKYGEDARPIIDNLSEKEFSEICSD